MYSLIYNQWQIKNISIRVTWRTVLLLFWLFFFLLFFLFCRSRSRNFFLLLRFFFLWGLWSGGFSIFLLVNFYGNLYFIIFNFAFFFHILIIFCRSQLARNRNRLYNIRSVYFLVFFLSTLSLTLFFSLFLSVITIFIIRPITMSRFISMSGSISVIMISFFFLSFLLGPRTTGRSRLGALLRCRSWFYWFPILLFVGTL